MILELHGRYAEAIDLLKRVLKAKEDEYGDSSSEVSEMLQEIERVSMEEHRSVVTQAGQIKLGD